jgi:hypothetical protein
MDSSRSFPLASARVDEFSYLSVLLSVVIGLAVTEILKGFRGKMLSHAPVTRYWPTQVWAGTMLLVCTQTWWAMFGLRNRHDWKFDEFLVVFVQTVFLYLICGLVFPDIPGDRAIDLSEHYFARRKRFFALLLMATCVSILRDLTLNHAWPDRANLTFHIFYIVTSLIAIITPNERYHKALAVFMFAVFMRYIASLFERLQ